MQFAYKNPTQIHFGQQQINVLSEVLPKNHKILFIYGGGSIKRNGVYDQVIEALAEHQWFEFSGVEANPTKETLDRAVQLVREQNIDFILAVGGGSVIDGAKYVAASALYAGEGWDILTGNYQVAQALPIGAILTLPATGSESNGNSVITKAETQTKVSFSSALVRPEFAILDPDVMKTLPERQLINGIVDAWVHVCEQYLTRANGNMVQDGYAETLLRSLKVLGEQFHERDNDQWRANLMWSANQALNGLIGCGATHDWSSHAIGHELTALWHVDHARSLAIIQPSLLRNQIKTKRVKLEQLGRNVFALPQTTDLAEQTINAIENFYQQLDVSTQFNGYGDITREQAIDNVIQQLELHQMTQLGENKNITLVESREILDAAFI